MLRICTSFHHRLVARQWGWSSLPYAMCLSAFCTCALLAVADEPRVTASSRLKLTANASSRALDEPQRDVELFTAMRDGDVSVELAALSSKSVWLKVANKTDSPLRVALPRAFAGVPVLAQFGVQNGGGGLLGGGGGGLAGLGGGNFGALGGGLGGQGGQGAQGLGGGFQNNNIGGNGIGNQFGGGNQFGNGLANGGPGGGLFCVPAGRIGKVQAQTVCLEHGKPDPRPQMKYRIIPLDEFTHGDVRISQLCQLLADRRITQKVAQAAAWHLANGLTWEQLAAKDQVRSDFGGSHKFFSSDELEIAMQVTESLAQQGLTPSGGR